MGFYSRAISQKKFRMEKERYSREMGGEEEAETSRVKKKKNNRTKERHKE